MKHQYIRIRINNTALLPTVNTTGERSPFTDFVYWFLNRINSTKSEKSSVEDRNSRSLKILSAIFAQELRTEDLMEKS